MPPIQALDCIFQALHTLRAGFRKMRLDSSFLKDPLSAQ